MNAQNVELRKKKDNLSVSHKIKIETVRVRLTLEYYTHTCTA